MQNHTLVMATLSDFRADRDFIDRLHRCGMNGIRINSAHIDPDRLEEMISVIRQVDPAIKILMDTKGPELRTTAPDATITLNEADQIAIKSSTAPSSARQINIPVDNMHLYVGPPGARILIDDGSIEATVDSIDNDKTINCTITRGGRLDSRKTIALPDGTMPPLPAVSQRDRLMIEAARRAGIDMIAHSFVRSKEDVEAVREIISDTPITLFAKIECRQALENLQPIANAADGLLVARGDLATSIDICHIPSAQYTILQCCRQLGKQSIVATQMLESMHTNPMPTRAEVSDIALAVMEGADWLLLCGETARGQYPAQAVDIMHKTIQSVESKNLRCKID